MSAIRLYGKLLRASVRSVMQYKFSFVLATFFQLWISVSDFLVVLTILWHVRAIGGWSAAQVGVLYGVATTSMALYRMFGSELHGFQNYIIRGEFDGLLLRPWPTLLVLLSRRMEFFRLGGVIQGLTALGISLHFLGGVQTLGWWRLLYVLTLPLTGAAIFFAIGIATSAIAFWTGRVRELQTFAVYAPSYACAYPVSIYPAWLRALLTLLPVAFIGFVPVRNLLGIGGQPWHLLTPLIVALVSLRVSLIIWRRGEQAYHSTGS